MAKGTKEQVKKWNDSYFSRHRKEYNEKRKLKYKLDPKFHLKETLRKKEYYKNNPEKLKEYQLKRKGIPRLRIRFSILQRDNFTCQYCGRKALDVILHIDHIHPKSKGGRTTKDNLITSCFDCNMGKCDVLLELNKQLI